MDLTKGLKTLKIDDFADKSTLIVDDDNPFRDRLARALDKKGFQTIQASSVKEANERLKSSVPKFV